MSQNMTVRTTETENFYLPIPGDRSEAVTTMTKMSKIIYPKLLWTNILCYS